MGIILVEIGLTDLSKSGGAMALPAPHGNDTLEMYRVLQKGINLIMIPIRLSLGEAS